jgi:hypothetical protein
MEGVLATSRIDTTMFLSTTDFFITCFRNILLMHDPIIHTQTHIYIYIYTYGSYILSVCPRIEDALQNPLPPRKKILKNSGQIQI